MKDISNKFENCIVKVRAGPGGESSDFFKYIVSPLPTWIKSVDDPYYTMIVSNALKKAEEIAKKTGKCITYQALLNVN
jgi:hypothetical protein